MDSNTIMSSTCFKQMGL